METIEDILLEINEIEAIIESIPNTDDADTQRVKTILMDYLRSRYAEIEVEALGF